MQLSHTATPDDIKYSVIMTPRGTFKWLVMPMDFKNAPPSTHQQRMNNALRGLIGRICHCYLNDIIIWSQMIEEHKKNVSTVMEALRKAELLCLPKKTSLFLTEVNFLGHRISAPGIEADTRRVEKILNWKSPRSAKGV